MFYVIDRHITHGNLVVAKTKELHMAYYHATRPPEFGGYEPKGSVWVTNEQYQVVDRGGSIVPGIRPLNPDDKGF